MQCCKPLPVATDAWRTAPMSGPQVSGRTPRTWGPATARYSNRTKRSTVKRLKEPRFRP
jgi:hypothetical protein